MLTGTSSWENEAIVCSTPSSKTLKLFIEACDKTPFLIEYRCIHQNQIYVNAESKSPAFVVRIPELLRF